MIESLSIILKDSNNTQGSDERRKTIIHYEEFFQDKYEDSMKAESTKEDVRLILNNFPPIKSLNAKYFRGLMQTLSPYTLWKRYGIAKRALEHYGIEMMSRCQALTGRVQVSQWRTCIQPTNYYGCSMQQRIRGTGQY